MYTIFFTPAASAYLRTCFIPLLASSTVHLASSIVLPLTGGKLAMMRALTPPIITSEISDRSKRRGTHEPLNMSVKSS